LKLNKQAKYKRDIQKHLYFSGELSCADLSVLIDKSVPLTTRVLNAMMEEGIVEELGYAGSTGGRRPQMFGLKDNHLLYMVCVAMDQMVTRIALLDMKNNCIGEIKKLRLTLNDNSDALNQLTQYLVAFIEGSGISKDKIIGIGIGMPGFVDLDKGINYSFLKASNAGSIVSIMQSATGVPVVIDNDSSLIALAELKFGAARGKQSAMVVNIGWGIGLGMVINGELYNGHNGFAGEFSHIPVFTNNKLCSCGKMGCLETEASLFIVVEKAIEELKKGSLSVLKDLGLDNLDEAARQIIEAAVEGDKFSIELLSESAYNIGRGVAILIHLLNPELIVLSGRGSVAGKIWKTPIQQAINEYCIPKIAENTEIEVSSLGYTAELIGAAALVMNNFDKLEIVRGQLLDRNLF
jgi:predicted NBD/HSP70 family sugar kinase